VAADIQQPCAVNTYQNKVGQTSCEPCPDGFYCPDLGMTAPNPCSLGNYCIGGVQTACPAGTFMNRYYAKAESECMLCPPGKYCELGSKAFSGYCDAGYVCVNGASSAAPTGTFNKADTTYAATNNGPCPVGNYCPRGSSFPVPCSPG